MIVMESHTWYQVWKDPGSGEYRFVKEGNDPPEGFVHVEDYRSDAEGSFHFPWAKSAKKWKLRWGKAK